MVRQCPCFLIIRQVRKYQEMGYSRSITISCEHNQNIDCAVEATLAVVGGKWKLKIYKVIRFKKVLRFSEIRDAIGKISDKTLSAQLREMEQDNLLTRIVFSETPLRVEYQLTELGESLEPVFFALEEWGKHYLNTRKIASKSKVMMLG